MARIVEHAAFSVGPYVVPLTPWSSEDIVEGDDGVEGASIRVSKDRAQDQRWLNHAMGALTCQKRLSHSNSEVPLLQEIAKAIDARKHKTRGGVRSHRRDLANPTCSFVRVSVRDRELVVRSTTKTIDVWVPKEGDEARDTLEWIINELRRGASGEDPPSGSETSPPGVPQAGTRATPAEEEQQYKDNILREISEDPRCDKILWLPSRSSFRLVAHGGMVRKEVRVKGHNRLLKAFQSGGSFRLLQEKYDEAKDEMEGILSSEGDDAAQHDAPPHDEPRDAGVHQEGSEEAHRPHPHGASAASEDCDIDGSVSEAL